MHWLINAMAKAFQLFTPPSFPEFRATNLVQGPPLTFGPGHSEVNRRARERRNQARNHKAHR
jgi:hypothetical protein